MIFAKEIFSVSLVLFSVIDILGSIPIIIDLKRKVGALPAARTTLVAGGIMLLFLYLGESILRLFGVDVSSFAVAGALIIFFIGLEMVMGIRLFREESEEKPSVIVPLAFPIIAGAGTMTTILSLRAEYTHLIVLGGILVNLLFVFVVLRSTDWIARKLGTSGANILRKVFGVILLAIAIKLFKTHAGL